MAQAATECPAAVVSGQSSPTRSGSLYKVSLCNFYRKNRCVNGAKCRFAHGLGELRGGAVGQRSRRSKRQARTPDNGETNCLGSARDSEENIGGSTNGSVGCHKDITPQRLEMDFVSAAHVLNGSSTAMANHPQSPNITPLTHMSYCGTPVAHIVGSGSFPSGLTPHHHHHHLHGVSPSSTLCPSSPHFDTGCGTATTPLALPTSPAHRVLWPPLCNPPMSYPLTPSTCTSSMCDPAPSPSVLGAQAPPWLHIMAIDLRDGRVYSQAHSPGHGPPQQPSFPAPLATCSSLPGTASADQASPSYGCTDCANSGSPAPPLLPPPHCSHNRDHTKPGVSSLPSVVGSRPATLTTLPSLGSCSAVVQGGESSVDTEPPPDAAMEPPKASSSFAELTTRAPSLAGDGVVDTGHPPAAAMEPPTALSSFAELSTRCPSMVGDSASAQLTAKILSLHSSPLGPHSIDDDEGPDEIMSDGGGGLSALQSLSLPPQRSSSETDLDILAQGAGAQVHRQNAFEQHKVLDSTGEGIDAARHSSQHCLQGLSAYHLAPIIARFASPVSGNHCFTAEQLLEAEPNYYSD